MIQTSKLTKHYGELEVLKGIDLSINENNQGLTLSKIVVPEGTRSEGVGSNVMKDIIEPKK